MDNPSFLFWFGSIVFVGTYVLIASEKLHKTVAALLGAVLMMLVVLPGPGHSAPEVSLPLNANTETVLQAETVLTTSPKQEFSSVVQTIRQDAERYSRLDTFARYSNFDVVFTLAGMMLLVNLLAGTGLFQYVAIMCAKLARGYPIRILILLVLATGGLSALLDNVTTILLVVPITLLVCSELKVTPIPFLMAETMASNIGGAATLIGDPPNLIIGSVANLNFMDFLLNLTPIIIVMMSIYCVVLWAYYSKRLHVTVEERAQIMELDEKSVISDRSNLVRGGIVMLLTIVGFLIHGAVGIQPCVVAMGGATLALCVCKVDVDHALEKIEWNTLFFFMALFILVCGAERAGLMAKIGELLNFMKDWPVPVTIIVIMWASAIAAAIMNNVSFTAAMVTVIATFIAGNSAFSDNPACRDLLWWGLALAVCLGGNASLVGAAANLVTVGIAEKNGVSISFGQFLRYGVPVTFGTMVLASAYILARYYLFCV